MTWGLFDAICEYIFFSEWTDIYLQFNVTDYERAYCRAFLDGWIY